MAPRTNMSAEFTVIFDDVIRFLNSKGVSTKIDRKPPATEGDLEEFTRATGVQLPPSFSEFFTTFSNGYEFDWESGEEAGAFSMPDLEQLAEMRVEWIERVAEFADDPDSMDQCIDIRYRADAFQIWRKMKCWVPFIEEADGDAFCLDLTSGAIVFDKHDWFDGFGDIAETNGMIAGATLLDFVRTWGRFCFTPMWFNDHPHPASQTHLAWLFGDSEFEREI